MLAAAFLSTASTAAWAEAVTGNPHDDGWGFSGNSLNNGTFVYTNNQSASKLYDFDIYSTSFRLQSNSVLLSSDWLQDDLIIGIGAVVNLTSNLKSTVRVLTKYGAENATFRASTIAPNDVDPPSVPNVHPVIDNVVKTGLWGDGLGNSASSGDGGVIMDTPQIWSGNTPWFNTTNEGSIVLIDGSTQPGGDPNGKAAHVTRFLGGSPQITNGLDQYGVVKMIYQLDHPGDLLSGFESYLNVSLLERNGFDDNPAPGDGFVIAIQNVSAEFTKATGTVPGGAVPEPSSLVLASLGLGGLVAAARRRRASL